jgi:hypothetical protein
MAFFTNMPVSFPHVPMLSIKSHVFSLATPAAHFMNLTYIPCGPFLPFILQAEVSFFCRPLNYSLVSQNIPRPSVCHISPPFPCYAHSTKHCCLLLLAYPFSTWKFHERNMACHISEAGAYVLGFQQYILHIIYVANIARRNFLKEGPA